MPKPHDPFKNLEEAIDILRKYGNEFNFPKRNYDKQLIIKKSVSGNIFRAFKNLDTKPSNIYRDWASDNFEALLHDFKRTQSYDDHYKLLLKYSESLLQRWSVQVLQEDKFLIYGQAMKMINLLIKQIQESNEFKQIDKIKFQQIPLDSYALVPIRLIINDLTDKNFKINIPPNVSMGFVNTPQLYMILSNAILKLSNLSKITPIVYDYWSWDEKHK